MTNNYDLLIPLLIEFKLKATIFVPSKFVGDVNEWDKDSVEIMNTETLASLDPKVIELALHSHSHQNFRSLSINEIEDDLKKNINFFNSNNIPFEAVLAYPYGAYPKESQKYDELKTLLSSLNINFAMRIGNRVNSRKPKDPFMLKRIDISGSDSFWRFKTKVNKGRIKVFQ